MSDYAWLDDLGNDGGDDGGKPPSVGDEQNGPKALRKAFQAKDKRVKELEQQVAELTARTRSVDIQAALSSLGVKNPKVANLIPESVASTEDAVKAWVDEYKDVFNLTMGPLSDGGEKKKTEDDSGGKQVSQEYKDGVARTSKIGDVNDSSSPASAASSPEEFLAGLALQGGSFEDLQEAFRNHKFIP